MFQTLPFTTSMSRLSLLVALLSLTHSCDTYKDCKLFGTCPGDLIARFEKQADADGACRECLERECSTEEAECAVDSACNYGARCTMLFDPLDYQECITTLRTAGYSDGAEERPWEGRYTEGGFISCASTNCPEACQKEERKWSCVPASTDDETLTAKIALRVQTFAKDRLPTNAKVRACSNGPTGRCQEGWKTVDEHGQATLAFKYRNAAAFHFEVVSHDTPPQFPPTLYYPGLLAASKEEQPVAVFVVDTDTIQWANNQLGFGYRVLEDRAQSLILVDSCVWTSRTTAGATIAVRDEDGQPLGSCAFQVDSVVDSKPCIWYPYGAEPNPNATVTSSYGGGVAGLTAGAYDIVILDKGRPVAIRNILMEAGWMTIARTWPATKEEKERLPEP